MRTVPPARLPQRGRRRTGKGRRLPRPAHRLFKPGGRLEIRVPHFSRGITHPEHKHGFDVTFPEYVRPGFQGGYIGVPLELDSMRLDYMIRWDLKGVAVRAWQLPILKAMN